MRRLDNKTAIITGGTSGIGRSTVLNFVEQGAKVLFTGRDQLRADETLEMVRKLGGSAKFVKHDIADQDDWIKVMNEAKSYFGTLDICVNCAGVFTYGAIEDTSIESFKNMWRINVDGAFLGIKNAMAAMVDNPNGGAIVNVASLSGLVGHASVVSYCTSKAGVIMLSKVAAMEAGPKIRVNAVAPGPVWNELLERAHANDDIDAMKEFYRNDQPLKVLGSSQDVSMAIVYLASDEASKVTGTVLRIDAGRGSD